MGSGVVEGGYNVVNSGGTVTVGKHRNFPAKYLAISEIYINMLTKKSCSVKGIHTSYLVFSLHNINQRIDCQTSFIVNIPEELSFKIKHSIFFIAR